MFFLVPLTIALGTFAGILAATGNLEFKPSGSFSQKDLQVKYYPDEKIPNRSSTIGH